MTSDRDLEKARAAIAEAVQREDKHEENKARRRYRNLLGERHKAWKQGDLPSMKVK